MLRADLAIPDGAVAIAAILHGSAGGRLDLGHQPLIDMLHEAGLATIRTDLFTAEETRGDHASGAPFFDVSLLVDRLMAMTSMLGEHADTRGLRVGLVGDRAVAAAALYAAAEYPGRVSAVVTRSARPDLAGPFFPRLSVPTLLLVGGHDPDTQKINEEAFRHLEGPRALEIIPEGSHQFEEPVARSQAAVLTRAWLLRHLASTDTAAGQHGAIV